MIKAQLYRVTINDSPTQILTKGFNNAKEKLCADRAARIKLIGEASMVATKETDITEYWLDHTNYPPFFGRTSEMTNELYSSLPENEEDADEY